MYYLDILRDNELILSLFWRDEDIPVVLEDINNVLFAIEMHSDEDLKFIVYHC